MPSNDLNFTISNGGLANAQPDVSKRIIFAGCSSSGTASVVAAVSDIATLKSLYGNGPLTEAAADWIDATGYPAYVYKIPTNTSGAAGSVTHTGTGTTVMTVSGNSADAYQVVINVTTGGTVGTSGIVVQYSLDNGNSGLGPNDAKYPLGTATTLVLYDGTLATGLTLSMTHAGSDTMVAGDQYYFVATAPIWATSAVDGTSSSLAAYLLTSSVDFGGIQLLGAVDGTDAAAINASMEPALFNAYEYAFIAVEARDGNSGESESTWMGSIISDFAAVNSDRLLGAGGYGNYASKLSTKIARRSVNWPMVVRAGQVSNGVDLARVKDGALRNFTLTNPSGPIANIMHDERNVPGLNAARFVCARSLKGKSGAYLYNANIMCAPGSDYSLMQYRRVMDAACRATRDNMQMQLSNDVRLDPKTGYILEKDARTGETKLRLAIKSATVDTGDASDCTAAWSRIDNISSTKALHCTVGVEPLGYLKTIYVTLGFYNPALSAS